MFEDCGKVEDTSIFSIFFKCYFSVPVCVLIRVHVLLIFFLFNSVFLFPSVLLFIVSKGVSIWGLRNVEDVCVFSIFYLYIFFFLQFFIYLFVSCSYFLRVILIFMLAYSSSCSHSPFNSVFLFTSDLLFTVSEGGSIGGLRKVEDMYVFSVFYRSIFFLSCLFSFILVRVRHWRILTLVESLVTFSAWVSWSRWQARR